MLEKLYENKTDKQLKSSLNIYAALLILSIIIPIIFICIGYFTSGRLQLSRSVTFIIIIIWCSINVNYLKKALKKNST